MKKIICFLILLHVAHTSTPASAMAEKIICIPKFTVMGMAFVYPALTPLELTIPSLGGFLMRFGVSTVAVLKIWVTPTVEFNQDAIELLKRVSTILTAQPEIKR